MDASERVSWADCPNCGGLVAVGWLDGSPMAVDCVRGCLLSVEQVHIPSADRDRATRMLHDVEQMAAVLQDAVLDTMEALGLTDSRLAAARVAGAWADILRKEGRSPRLVELASATVREVGDRLHRRQISAAPQHVRDASDDIRVLVVDEHPLARLRLIEMFSGEADLSVVGECEGGSQVVEAAARLRPDVVCLDGYMPIMDGLAATQALRATAAEVRIILLTGDSRRVRGKIALAGVDALVPKEAGRDALLRCLRTVARRGTGCPYCL
jgi:CheY-like chemotaxis protein